MEIKLNRIFDFDDLTIGAMHYGESGKAFTLEDQYQEGEKVPGETRIPAGRYRIKLRIVGGMHNRYTDKYDFHRGMLWLQDVPGFSLIYLHVGNTDKHTKGCILVGDGADLAQERINYSVNAYKKVYLSVIAAIERGEDIYITITD